MSLRRSLLALVISSLALAVAVPALAPATGGSSPTATAAKKCKKGYKKVHGKCKKKKKTSTSGLYKGTPPEITIAVSGGFADFKWDPVKCPGATGAPATFKYPALVENGRLSFNVPFGTGYKIKFVGKFEPGSRIHGQVTVSGTYGEQVCGASVTLRK